VRVYIDGEGVAYQARVNVGQCVCLVATKLLSNCKIVKRRVVCPCSQAHHVSFGHMPAAQLQLHRFGWLSWW
jgi:hypothetical protein